MPERTKKAILDAFNRLITKREFDQITSLDLAKEAGISKATFYRYFKDKYDVMNYNYKNLLDNCLKDATDYRDLFYKLYYEAEANWKHLYRAFNTTGINSFENYIYTYSMEIAETITKQNRNGKGYTPEELLQVDVFCYGTSYMYKKWTLGKYDLTADEAADLLYDMLPTSLRYYWFTEDYPPKEMNSP